MNISPPNAANLSSAPVVVSDETLLDRLRNGDAAAGEALSLRYLQPILRYLRRLVGSEQLAEELHQQTWISVLEHAESFDASSTSGGFRSWLFRIATNKARDHWRSKAREKAAKEGLKLMSETDAPASDQRLEGAEQHEKLRQAIERLPENQKQVLLMRYYGNMKFSEIAQALDCPLNTALGRMHKAMLKLKELMND